MSFLLSPLVLVISCALGALMLPHRSDRQLAASALVLLALAAASTTIAPGDGPVTTLIARATRAGVSRPTLLVNAALAAVGLLLLAAAAVRAWRRPALLRSTGAASAALSWRSPVVLLSVAVLLAPTLWTLTVAAAALAAAAVPAGRQRIVHLLAAALPLGAVAWFACTVGGTWDVWLTRLGDVPLSEVAQRAAVVPLLAGALYWTLGALNASVERRAASWVGVLLIARVTAPLVPDGLDALAPIIWPAIAGLVLLAAWRRRSRGAAVAALLLAAVPTTLEPIPAVLLVLATLALVLTASLAESEWPRTLAWAAAAAAATLVLPQVMRVQVVWTLGVLLALVVAIWRGAPATPAGEDRAIVT